MTFPQCLSNHFQPDSPCRYFMWRYDIPRRHPSGTPSPPGPPRPALSPPHHHSAGAGRKTHPPSSPNPFTSSYHASGVGAAIPPMASLQSTSFGTLPTDPSLTAHWHGTHNGHASLPTSTPTASLDPSVLSSPPVLAPIPSRGRHDACPSETCLGRAKGPNHLHKQCRYKLCADCCRTQANLHPSAPPCKVSNHWVAQRSVRVAAPGSKSTYSSDSSSAYLLHILAAPISASVTKNLPSSAASGPYGRNLNPQYREKLDALNAGEWTSPPAVTSSPARERAVYQTESAQMISVEWRTAVSVFLSRTQPSYFAYPNFDPRMTTRSPSGYLLAPLSPTFTPRILLS